ncbi:MAG: hypothetical protein QF411_09035 [Planctomycetota bacterium]|nr:hypothetical protein [Planctomycetota bacterium]
MRIKSGRGGDFVFEDVPTLSAALLTAKLRRHRDARSTIVVPPPSALRIILHTGGNGLLVTGRVLLPDGSPAGGAEVALGEQLVRADPAGRFALSSPPEPPEDVVLAAGLKGYAPALVENFGVLIRAAAPSDPEETDLWLGAGDLTITGLVQDAAQQPLRRWEVQPLEPLQLCERHGLLRTVEGLGRGANGKARTGLQGTFSLSGLLPRSYTLRVWNPETLASFVSDPIPAGTRGVRITVPASAMLERVAGRVLSREGAGIPGVIVTPGRLAKWPDGAPRWIAGQKTTSDGNGSFELFNIGTSDMALEVSGPFVVPEYFALDGTGGLVGGLVSGDGGSASRELKLVATRLCELEVIWRGADLKEIPEELLAVEVHTASGTQLDLFQFAEWGGLIGGRRLINDPENLRGLRVSEDGARLVLVNAGTDSILAEQPISLHPEQIARAVVEAP